MIGIDQKTTDAKDAATPNLYGNVLRKKFMGCNAKPIPASKITLDNSFFFFFI